jgi:hypothetical protein
VTIFDATCDQPSEATCCSVLQERYSLFTFPTQRAGTAVFLALDFLPTQDGVGWFLVRAFDDDSGASLGWRIGKAHRKAVPSKFIRDRSERGCYRIALGDRRVARERMNALPGRSDVPLDVVIDPPAKWASRTRPIRPSACAVRATARIADRPAWSRLPWRGPVPLQWRWACGPPLLPTSQNCF